jgi:hypothetical protein
MNSSMVEQMFVRHHVESSPDSYRDYHSHNGESPAGHGCCLENRLGIKASRVRISFSPQKYFGELAER